MRGPKGREAVGGEPLGALARAVLIVERTARIDVRCEDHRPATLTGIDGGVELLHADQRVEDAALADDELMRGAREHIVVPDVGRDRLRIERVQPGVGRLPRRDHR